MRLWPAARKSGGSQPQFCLRRPAQSKFLGRQEIAAAREVQLLAHRCELSGCAHACRGR